MTRTLIAFGDSHTAGAEIETQHDYKCFEKAYPSYIAKHYGFQYENFSEAGGSNDLSFKKFNDKIKNVIINKEKVFVLFNFTESSRTYLTTAITPESKQNWDKKYYGGLNFYPAHLSPNIFLDNPQNPYEKELKLHLPIYRHYIASNTIKDLDEKSINQMFIVQTICQKYNIPFIFHNSIHWYSGDWALISKKNHFGHHNSVNFKYNLKVHCPLMESLYSFWGLAKHHSDWKHLQRLDRWHGHYPEEYHKYYASLLINFIDNQKLLEGYI